MKINKVKSIVRRMTRSYGNYEEIIDGLKTKKESLLYLLYNLKQMKILKKN